MTVTPWPVRKIQMTLTERTVVPAARLTMYSIRTMTGPTPYIRFPVLLVRP
jgi:hypothetical protein